MSAQSSRPGLSARIGMHHGAAALLVDGRPTAAIAYVTFDPDERIVRQFADAGVELFSFQATCDHDYYGLAADARPTPDQYDYGQFRERMARVLRAAPQAKVLLRVSLSSPPWWDKAHPDQLMCGADGRPYDPEHPVPWPPAAPPPGKRTAPSFASQAWRAEAGAALERFLAAAEDEFGGRIIGYHLCSGAWHQWCYWGTMENVFPDTSPPQQEAFRQWLKRRRWAGVRDQEVPTLRERVRAEFGEFRDPTDRTASLAVEYSRFHSEVLVEAIAELTARARGAVGPDKLLGVSYGQFVDLQRHASAWHTSGHLAMRKFLADPNVNFVAGPTAACDRRPGRGVSLFASVTESVTHRGKLWWDESDLAAPLVPAPAGAEALPARSPEELRHMERREFANALCHGAGLGWLDAHGGAGPSADVRRMVEISRKALYADRSPVAEIAVVLDDVSVHDLRCDNRLTAPLVTEQLAALGHVEAPFSVVHVDDLGDVARHKLYIILNCFHATENRLKRICQVTRAPGATVLWFYAPGLVGETLSAERMERLTGIRLAMDLRAAPLEVRAAGALGEAEYGTGDLLAPVVYADDPAAEVLGQLVESRRSSTGPPWRVRAGLVRKKIGGATAVFSTAPAMPANLLRQLAADAGVHIYAADGEAVYANRSLLAVAAGAGKRPHVRLPQPGPLYELFEEKETLLRTGEGRVTAPPDGMCLFYRGTRKQWEALGA